MYSIFRRRVFFLNEPDGWKWRSIPPVARPAREPSPRCSGHGFSTRVTPALSAPGENTSPDRSRRWAFSTVTGRDCVGLPPIRSLQFAHLYVDEKYSDPKSSLLGRVGAYLLKQRCVPPTHNAYSQAGMWKICLVSNVLQSESTVPISQQCCCWSVAVDLGL